MDVVLCNTDSKDLYSQIDDTEIMDYDDGSDSNEVSFSESIGDLIYHKIGFNCIFLSNGLPLGCFLHNVQEIFLGLTIPPPKYFFC